MRPLLWLPLALAGCSQGGAQVPAATPAAPSPDEVDAALRLQGPAVAAPSSRALASAPGPVQPVAIRPPRQAPRRRSGRRVDVELHRAALADALQFLASEARINLVMGEGIAGEVSLSLRGIDPLEALEALASSRDLSVEHQGAVTLVRRR